jgi:hypothetical protein
MADVVVTVPALLAELDAVRVERDALSTRLAASALSAGGHIVELTSACQDLLAAWDAQKGAPDVSARFLTAIGEFRKAVTP